MRTHIRLSRLSLLLPLALSALFPGNSQGQTTTPPPDCIFFINATLTAGSPATISYPTNQVTGVVGFDNRTLACQTWTFSYVATATSGTITSLAFQSASGAISPGSYSNWGGTVATGINPNTSSVQATSTFNTGCASMMECNVVDAWVKILLTRNNFVGTIQGVLYGYRTGYAHSGGGGGGGSTRTVNLYYAPAAKDINGVGSSVFQCASSCGIPTAIASGTTVTAALDVTGTMNNQDQFIVPQGYGNQTVSIEVVFRSADNTGGHNATGAFTSVTVGADGDIVSPTFGNATTLTLAPSSTAEGRTVVTGTFTPSPSWTPGDTAYWKVVWTQNTLTSALEVLSVRFYATF